MKRKNIRYYTSAVQRERGEKTAFFMDDGVVQTGIPLTESDKRKLAVMDLVGGPANIPGVTTRISGFNEFVWIEGDDSDA